MLLSLKAVIAVKQVCTVVGKPFFSRLTCPDRNISLARICHAKTPKFLSANHKTKNIRFSSLWWIMLWRFTRNQSVIGNRMKNERAARFAKFSPLLPPPYQNWRFALRTVQSRFFGKYEWLFLSSDNLQTAYHVQRGAVCMSSAFSFIVPLWWAPILIRWDRFLSSQLERDCTSQALKSCIPCQIAPSWQLH